MIQELFTGLIVGILFEMLGLAIPAPNNLSGIFGIIGIFVGFFLMKSILHK